MVLWLLAKKRKQRFTIYLANCVNEIRADKNDPALRKQALWEDVATQFNIIDVIISQPTRIKYLCSHEKLNLNDITRIQKLRSRVWIEKCYVSKFTACKKKHCANGVKGQGKD